MVEGMEPGHAADELEKRLRQLMEQQVQQLEQRLEAKVGQRLCQIMEQQVQQLEESLEAKVSRICRQMEAKDLEHADLLQQLERMGAKGMHTLQDNLQQQVDELQTKHTVMAESLRAWIDLLADDKASDGGEDDDKSGESGEEEAPDMHGSTDEEDDDNEDLDELSDNIQAGESKIIEKEMNKNPTARLDRRPLRVARRTAVRQEELVASVDTVGRAIKIIEKEMNKNPTARLDRRPLRVARRTAVRQEELVASVDTVGRAIKIIEEEMSTNPAIFTQIANKGFVNVMSTLCTIVEAAGFSSSDQHRLTEKELVATADTVGRAFKIIEEEMSKSPAIFAQIVNKGFANVMNSLSTIAGTAGFAFSDQHRSTAMVSKSLSRESEAWDKDIMEVAVQDAFEGQ